MAIITRVCFVGDSFVNGTGDPAGLGWIGRICVAARRRGHDVTVYNLGIRRDTSADIARRWQEEAARRLPADCDARLVFSFGANDCILEGGTPRVPAEQSLEHALVILGMAIARHPTLMVGPPPITIDGADVRIRALSRGFARICSDLDVPYLDLCTPLTATPLWQRETSLGDGAHPGAGGYALIAELIEGWKPWRQWFA